MKVRYILIMWIMILFSNVHSQDIRIIPNPQEIIIGEGSIVINREVNITYHPKSYKSAWILQSHIEQLIGFKIGILEKKGPNNSYIQFNYNDSLPEEAYEIVVSDEGIEMIASSNSGWYYAIQSLIQLFPTLSDAKMHVSELEIPKVHIKDAPRFSWRAFMLDEARYFKGKEQVKILLDEMSHLKMNVFHWHLVDDQGWRIEIKKYPLLTEIGSKRKSTQVGPEKWQSHIQSAEPHTGFYTQEEIKEIIRYAEDRHITIVPEIEMPGHSSAAIASYSWLGTAKKKIRVPIRFGVGKDVYDVSDPKVYQFLTNVLDEVMALFPSQVIHIGGDEVKYNHWKNSQSVQTYMKENSLATPADLQIFFTNNISQYLAAKGRRMMGWNEIMGHNLHQYQNEEDTKAGLLLAPNTIVHFWKGDVALATEAASNGYDIVNSLHSYTYLDYSYESIPLSKAYGFDPVPQDLDPKFKNKVIGTGCQMWGEWIPTDGHMHYQAFPRIAAYAEVGWTEKKNKDFRKFKLSLEPLKKRWKAKGIYFAPNEVTEETKE